MWHHKSVIALFQIVLRLLIDLIALIALAFPQTTSRVGGQLNQDDEKPQHRSIMPWLASRFDRD